MHGQNHKLELRWRMIAMILERFGSYFYWNKEHAFPSGIRHLASFHYMHYTLRQLAKTE